MSGSHEELLSERHSPRLTPGELGTLLIGRIYSPLENCSLFTSGNGIWVPFASWCCWMTALHVARPSIQFSREMPSAVDLDERQKAFHYKLSHYCY